MTPRFRDAAPADVPALVAMMAALYEHDGTPFDAAAHEAVVRDLLAHPAYGRLVVIEDGTEPVGYLVLTFGFSLEFRGRDAFVDELYLAARARGAGVGRAAMAHAAALCRAEGVRALHLEVERTNTDAQAFYRRLGFADHDRYLLTRWVDAPEAE